MAKPKRLTNRQLRRTRSCDYRQPETHPNRALMRLSRLLPRRSSSQEYRCDHPLCAGEDVDARGRNIEGIWLWNDTQLEDVHDYIQWLFPLRGKSQFNQLAPILTEEAIDAFRRKTFLRMRLKRSLEMMLEFYRLQLSKVDDETYQVKRGPDFIAKVRNWLSRGNHNHLRLTRIIKSTKSLGLETCSSALFSCLEGIYEEYPSAITTETYRYWKEASLASNSCES